ncbi:MAG: STAS domain-containing protein [Actinomycetota bacterium]
MTAFETEVVGGVARVRASGDLDFTSAPGLERALLAVDADDEVRSVVLDLRSLRFLDSTGLRVVLATDARLRSQGRPLTVVKGPPSVHRVFQLALAEDRIHFVEDATTDRSSIHGSPTRRLDPS